MKTIEEASLSFRQHTLGDSFTCMGPGLHTGLKTIMTVMPAEANTGYRFFRKDVPQNRNEVHASWHAVTNTHLCTTIANGMGVRVCTVEHLIAALHACGVDNARIVLDGPEVPILDGSAKPYVRLINSVGLKSLEEERFAIVIKQTVRVKDGDKEAWLIPSPEPWINLEIDFDSEAIGRQAIAISLNAKNFCENLADARTFGFAEQLGTLRKLGFARGGSLDNAVLINEDSVVNKEGLRYKDEFVRHKVVDTIGDLALAGAPILGYFRAKHPGHKLNNQLLHELMLNESAYDYVPMRILDCELPGKSQHDFSGLVN